MWRYQVDFLAVEEALVSYRLVTRAREVNLPLYVWSVYDAEKMEQQFRHSGLLRLSYNSTISRSCQPLFSAFFLPR